MYLGKARQRWLRHYTQNLLSGHGSAWPDRRYWVLQFFESLSFPALFIVVCVFFFFTHSGLVYCKITDFYHQWLDASPQNFYTRHWVGPHKSVSNRAPHFLTPALPPRFIMKILFLSLWSPMISSQYAESIRNMLCNSVQAFTTWSAVLRFTANGTFAVRLLQPSAVFIVFFVVDIQWAT